MAFDPLLSTETDAKSPIDQNLMDTIRLDFDDHEARILALESGGGSGGGASSGDPRYGAITVGLETNEAKLWRKRYSAFQNILKSGEKLNNQFGFDPEGSDLSRWIGFQQPNATNFSSDAKAYNAHYCSVGQGNSVSFKIKKGENFFGIGTTNASTSSNQIRVKIDGVSITSFGGITDETGAAGADTYTSVSATTLYQSVKWFFGLDGQEHIIEILNDDTGSNSMFLEFIEVGYASPKSQFTPDLNLNVKPGRFIVRGVGTSSIETDLTFGASSGYGHTAAVIGTTAGSLSVLNGVEPAMTQALPQETITFSSAVSTIKAKNTKFFPSTGFLLVSTPWGGHFIASYTGKTESTIAQHQFTGMKWQSQPSKDFTPLNNIDSDTAGDATGDLNINYWASGGHVISSSNNKLDFKVTVNGIQTTHAATISNGLYSADLVPLGAAIVNAMKAVKPLTNGEYFCEYNQDAQRWTIGIRGAEQTELQLLFSTGSNSANSIHTTLGFSTADKTAKTAYVAENEVQSLAHKVFRAEKSYISATDPRVQYIVAPDASPTDQFLQDAEERLGFGYVYKLTSENPLLKIFPESDACGILLNFLATGAGSGIIVQVDYGNHYYLLQPDTEGLGSGKRGEILSCFVSFPRGSRTISVWQHDGGGWEASASTNNIFFVGAKQYFTKPKEEALTTTQAILKTFDVAPKQFFKTPYAHSYSPQATKDNIDTITYTGSWSNGSANVFNGSYNLTNTSGDYVDITFTTVGANGGISIGLIVNTGYSKKVGFFLVSGATGSETSSRVQNVRTSWSTISAALEHEAFTIQGLPAGQYTLRVKNENASTLQIVNINVIDTVAPDSGATVTDVTNTGQGVTYPINTIKNVAYKDSVDRVPPWLFRSGYKEGHCLIDYAAQSDAVYDFNDNSTVLNENAYFTGVQFSNDADFLRSIFFGKSVCTLDGAYTTGTSQVNPVLDARNPANKYAISSQVKGGSAPGATRQSWYPLYSRHVYELLTSNMPNSTTINIGNTRGFKVGHQVILEATGQPTLKRTIATVTTDSSITVTEAVSTFANYTIANSASVKAYGLHVLKLENDNANPFYFSAFCYEPLDLSQSKDDVRRAEANRVGEVATVTFKTVANGDDIYYPYFQDGRQATAQECAIQVIGASAATAFSFPRDLKNISVGGVNTIDVKITAVRGF